MFLFYELVTNNDLHYEALLMFNLLDRLPGGDLVLETLASMLTSHHSDKTTHMSMHSGMYSISALAMLSNLGLEFGSTVETVNETGLLMGDIIVGEMTSLERAIAESRNDFKKVKLAQATVDGVKVEGIDTNLAVMMELLRPLTEIGSYLFFLASWKEPIQSFTFCCIGVYVICRGWVGYAIGLVLLSIAVFMLVTMLLSQGRPVDEVRIRAPPPMNKMEQLLAVQNAISQVEELVQDGNVILLKLRALLLAAFPQATERVALALIFSALVFIFVPCKYIMLLSFLELFTCYCPLRESSTERWMRRLREWWFSIPAAPVALEGGAKEDKKKR